MIVRTTIDMCHSLGYTVVAEGGVEDEETLSLLHDMGGCDLVQGYFLTRPLPFNEMVDWLGNYNPQALRSRISAS